MATLILKPANQQSKKEEYRKIHVQSRQHKKWFVYSIIINILLSISVLILIFNK